MLSIRLWTLYTFDSFLHTATWWPRLPPPRKKSFDNVRLWKSLTLHPLHHFSKVCLQLLVLFTNMTDDLYSPSRIALARSTRRSSPKISSRYFSMMSMAKYSNLIFFYQVTQWVHILWWFIPFCKQTNPIVLILYSCKVLTDGGSFVVFLGWQLRVKFLSL